jgi:hypothetical protein
LREVEAERRKIARKIIIITTEVPLQTVIITIIIQRRIRKKILRKNQRKNPRKIQKKIRKSTTVIIKINSVKKNNLFLQRKRRMRWNLEKQNLVRYNEVI